MFQRDKHHYTCKINELFYRTIELLATYTKDTSGSITYTYTGADKANLTTENFSIHITAMQINWTGGGGSSFASHNLLTYDPSTGKLKILTGYTTWSSGSTNYAEGKICSFKLYVYH